MPSSPWAMKGLTYYRILPGAGDCNEVHIAHHICGDVDPLHGMCSVSRPCRDRGQHGQSSMQDMTIAKQTDHVREGEHIPILEALCRPWWLHCASAGSCRDTTSGLVAQRVGVTALVMGAITALPLWQVSCCVLCREHGK